MHYPGRAVAVASKIVYRVSGVAVYRHGRKTDQRLTSCKTHRNRVTGFRESYIPIARGDTHRIKRRRGLVKGHTRRVGYTRHLDTGVPGSIYEVNCKDNRAFSIQRLHHPGCAVAVASKIIHRISRVPVYRHRRQTDQRLAGGEAQSYRIAGLCTARVCVARCDTHRRKGWTGLIKCHACRVGHHRHLDARVPGRVCEVDAKGYHTFGV